MFQKCYITIGDCPQKWSPKMGDCPQRVSTEMQVVL